MVINVNTITLTLPDGSHVSIEKGSTGYDAAVAISKGLQKAALAMKLNGTSLDLNRKIETDASLEIITISSPEGKNIFWHSASHLMAQAVKRLYPDAKYTIGPAIESGFYYDFDVSVSISVEDLEKIESEMKKIVEEDLKIVREEVPRDEAIRLFESMGESYKVELLREMDGASVSLYRQGEFVDLCRGPHLPRTSYIKAFKLTSVAGAYWRGDEKNKMLQRIYGIAFPDPKELKKYLDLLEEARQRDHRKLGRELELFSFDNEVGAGLPLWHPKGAMLRHLIEKFSIAEHIKRGYKLLTIPHIARAELYKTSGHLDFYTENMYAPIKIDNQDYYIKPMNCPTQIRIFKTSIWSYRNLPFRAFEMGTVYRYERSGVLHGLTRVRGFTQDDAHIFCREDQVRDEIKNVLEFVFYMLAIFGFTERNVYLSTRPEKSVGSDEHWDLATAALRESLESLGVTYEVDPGEGVFYGPKIDIKIKDALGREWQCSTIQVDFNLPERFDVYFIGNDGQKHRPIMIHRALLGSLERFIGILIEHYAGRFPLWLAPVQIMLINVNDDQADYTKDLTSRLLQEEVRAECDIRSETLGYKVRDAIAKRVPYIGVIGAREAEADMIALRTFADKNSVSVKTDELIARIKKESAEKK